MDHQEPGPPFELTVLMPLSKRSRDTRYVYQQSESLHQEYGIEGRSADRRQRQHGRLATDARGLGLNSMFSRLTWVA